MVNKTFIKDEDKLKEATYVVSKDELPSVKDKFEKDDVVKVVKEDYGKVLSEKNIKNDKYVLYDNLSKRENWKVKENKTYIPVAKYTKGSDKASKVYLGEDGKIYENGYFNEESLKENYRIKKSILKEFLK